jgi:RimJ/RimL family protein N-acetyltransferase
MNIRLAKKSDMLMLYNWFNQIDSIKNKLITKKKISKEEHIFWYENSLKNENRFIWIIEEETLAIGQIRFDIDEDEKLCFIDIYIEKKYRNKKYGKEAIFCARNYISKKRRLKYLVALVLKSNMNSFNFFSSMGFIKYKTGLEFYDLRLNIEKNNEE